MKKALGITLIALPFLLIIIFIIHQYDAMLLLKVFGTAISIVLTVALGLRIVLRN